MAKEISISLFERNAKIFNKKGLRRAYSSIATKYNEYIPLPPLGATSKYVFEVNIDKEYVEAFISFLKEREFEIIGSVNYYFIEKIVNDFHKNEEPFKGHKATIEEFEVQLKDINDNKKDFIEVENDDAKFYFLPFNSNIETLFEFIGVYKEQIISFAKENDITIMLKPIGYSNQLEGFFGFNFFDAEKPDEEITIDYSSSLVVKTDFSNKYSVYASSLLLNGIGENESELNVMDVHLVGDKLKYE
ncbi:MAG: hypothetical protein ACI35S_05890 [Anaeroplasma sp.]